VEPARTLEPPRGWLRRPCWQHSQWQRRDIFQFGTVGPADELFLGHGEPTVDLRDRYIEHVLQVRRPDAVTVHQVEDLPIAVGERAERCQDTVVGPLTRCNEQCLGYVGQLASTGRAQGQSAPAGEGKEKAVLIGQQPLCRVQDVLRCAGGLGIPPEQRAAVVEQVR
jgi:hypothetical protein